MRFVKLEKLINLHEGYQRCFVVEGKSLLLVHSQNQSHLFLNNCPHRNKAFGENSLQESNIRCPGHGLCFDLDSGVCTSPENYWYLPELSPKRYQQSFPLNDSVSIFSYSLCLFTIIILTGQKFAVPTRAIL
jgi:nitrite reductase/ring-hydroxylating ferredoxin subunit